MLIRYILQISMLLGICCNLQGQNCSNPIGVETIIVQKSTCTNATGTIIVKLVGGENGVDFFWTPSLPNVNDPSNLAAGAYKLHMVRQNMPECVLDTTIIIPNNDGPSLADTLIKPANCLITNGAISLFPSTNIYHWENGTINNTIQNVASGCYLVTVTQSGSGCTTVYQICVPNVNPLQSSIQILENAKCELNTAIVQATVTGGSGNYTYNLGNSSLLTGLGPGPQSLVINDVNSGCRDTVSYSIPIDPAEATYDLIVHPVTCEGRTDGRIEIANFNPGANFEMPYDFVVVKGGFLADPNHLSIGNYELYLVDNDSCQLPIKTFTVGNPPPIMVQPAVSPVSCNSEGQIFLNATGGLGKLHADWTDLPGSNNPLDRKNLLPGVYSGIVYDSFSCVFNLDSFKILSNCDRKTYIHQVIQANTTEPFCINTLPGINFAQQSVSLLAGGLSGNSPFGSWFLPAQSTCLSYSAGSTTGFALDTVCLKRLYPALGVNDTICFVISITSTKPAKKSIQFSLPVISIKEVCGDASGFNNFTVTQLNRPGLEGTSGSYGAYIIDGTTGCLNFYSFNNVGNFVDEIAVMLYDNNQKQAKIFNFIPSILPVQDCKQILNLTKSWTATTQDCEKPAEICLPIPYSEIGNFSISNNGQLYQGLKSGCNEDTKIIYTISDFPSDGPYILHEWKINGSSYSGTFTDKNDLIAFMNLKDPNNWSLRLNATQLVGGNTSLTYGNLSISSQSANRIYLPTQQSVFSSTSMGFNVGTNVVILNDNKSGCSDTITVSVDCKLCPPIHNYPVDGSGNITLTSYFCNGNPNADIVLCTNIQNNNLGQFSVSMDGNAFTNFMICGSNIGLRFGVGTHHFSIRDNSNDCIYDFDATLKCITPPISQEENVQLVVGGMQTVCLDMSDLEGPVTSVTNVCGSSSTFFNWTMNGDTCLSITGTAVGEDTICVQICDNTGACFLAMIQVQVTAGMSSDSLVAVDDVVSGVKDQPIPIPVIANDTINGIVGNLSGLSNVVLGSPGRGSVVYDASSGTITYTPYPNICGIDSFSYTIFNPKGEMSTATVTVKIECLNIQVFNGFSPNNDGVNDFFQILGIGGYPNNSIKIFNRWGNLVYEAQPYSNSNPWDGRWNGQDLPDGTYFYILDLGDRSQRLNGFIELQR